MAQLTRIRWTGIPLLLLLSAGLAAVLNGSPAGAGAYTVNTTADTPDITPGDGVCADAGGSCSLRAAVVEANARPGEDQISLPTGTFTIGLPGEDDASAVGDFDVNSIDAAALTITGGGAGATIIDGGSVDRVFHAVAGSVTIGGVTIRNGVRGAGGGGGVFVAAAASMTLRDAELRGNSAPEGGGLRNEGATILTRVLVAGNSGSGGLSNAGGTLTVVNTTITTNSGPGVRSTGGGTGLTHATITGNSGAGIQVAGGNVTVRNAIVSGNVGDECSGAVGSQGHNVVEDSTCSPTSTDRPSNDPRLVGLTANGGPTQTHALGAGSPAIDLVAEGSCPVGDDQRGIARPVDGSGDGLALCDAGAFEVGAAPAPAGSTTTTRAGQVPTAQPVTGRPTTAG